MNMKFIQCLTFLFISNLAILGGALLQGVHFAAFFQPIAFLGVVGFTLSFLILHFSVTEIKANLKAAFSKEEESEKALLKAENMFFILSKYLNLAGLICAFLGLFHLLRNVSDTAQIGSGIAVAFVAVLYAYALKIMIVLPLEYVCARRLQVSQPFALKSLMLPVCVSVLLTVTTICLISHFLGSPLLYGIFANLLIVMLPSFVLFQSFRFMERTVVASSMLALIIGLIHTMANLGTFETIVAGLGVSLTGPFYALCLMGFLSGLRKRMVPSPTAHDHSERNRYFAELVQYGMSLLLLATLFLGTNVTLNHHTPSVPTQASMGILPLPR